MIAYKLFSLRKDGSLGPLFINRSQRIRLGIEYEAGNHPTVGYTIRPGWHCCEKPYAPHLSEKGRVWYKIKIKDYIEHKRPEYQGGKWFVAQYMTVLGPVAGYFE